MNAKTLLCCVVVLLCCSLLQAQTAVSSSSPTKTIPGGIAAQGKKSRDIFYSDFATKEIKNLTKNDGAKPDFFAVSENGKAMLLASAAENMQLKRRILPSCQDQLIQTVYKGRKTSTQMGYVLDEHAESLTISPLGDKFSYERNRIGESLVRSNFKSTITHDNAPWYECINETYHVVYFATIGENLSIGDESGCGNSAFFPPTAPYKVVGKTPPAHYEGRQLVQENFDWPVDTGTWKRGTALTIQETVKRFAVKRNAYFGAWSKDSKLFAAIYQMPGYCCIEINDSTPFFSTGKGYERKLSGAKPGYYEIPLRITSCQGLAWKPDGSLTYLYENKVYSLDGVQIQKGINNSGLGINPGQRPIPVNNVFSITPALVAEGIDATKFYWTSDNAFIFRNQEGALMSWYSGTTEKLLKSVPEIFFYCNTAPAIDESVLIAKKPAAKQEAPQIIGTPNEALDVPKETRVFQLPNQGIIGGTFYAGAIKVRWLSDWDAVMEQHKNKQPPKPFSLRILVGKDIFEKAKKQKALNFVILKDADLDSIKDPSIYAYRNGDSVKESYVNVAKNDGLLLNMDDYYVAMKLIHLEPKYHSRAQAPMTMLKFFGLDWDWKLGPIPIYKSLTCECKFWQDLKAAKPPELAKTAQNK